MKKHATLNTVYAVSANVVVRKIEDEVIIIPFVKCEDNMENEPCILDTTGQAILRRLDGKKRLEDIVANLAAEFSAPAVVIEKDVIAFIKKLLKRKLLVDVSET
jgi:hypothetical protein